MFRTLIYPSSGACDYSVELPHWSYCSWFDVCWRFGVIRLEWYPCCRIKPATRIPLKPGHSLVRKTCPLWGTDCKFMYNVNFFLVAKWSQFLNQQTFCQLLQFFPTLSSSDRLEETKLNEHKQWLFKQDIYIHTCFGASFRRAGRLCAYILWTADTVQHGQCSFNKDFALQRL